MIAILKSKILRIQRIVLAGFLIAPFVTASAESPSENSCPLSDLYLESIDQSPESRVEEKPDYSCFVDSMKLNEKDFLIVDIRYKTSFEQNQIDGSINLTPNLLVHSSHLKNHSILIVDHGLNREKTARLCSLMKRTGFPKTYIVEGGVQSWFESKNKKLKDQKSQALSSLQDLWRISAMQLALMSYENELVILTDVPEPSAVIKSLSNLAQIHVVNLAKLDSEITRLKLKGSSKGVVLVSRSPDSLSADLLGNGIYALEQDVDLLIEASAKIAASQAKRMDIPDRYRCGA